MRALDDQVRAGKILYPAVSDWAAWEIAEASTAARLRDWSPFTAVQLRYNLLDRTPERELLPMAARLTCRCSPGARWPKDGSPANTSPATPPAGRPRSRRPYTSVGSDDIVRDVVAISREIGCSPAQVAISWVRQQPGPVIPLIAARTKTSSATTSPPPACTSASSTWTASTHSAAPPSDSPPMSCGRPRSSPGLRRPAPRHRRPPRAGRAPHHHQHLVEA